MSDFFRFPHTPHLAWLGKGTPRDDKVLSVQAANALLSQTVRVEEKMDGANLGFSVAPDGSLRAQNRGQYLIQPHAGQFSRLTAWLAMYQESIAPALGHDLMLFGEWCAARHSVDYDALPDLLLAFDIYDRKNARFWCAQRRDAWCKSIGIRTVPMLTTGKMTLSALRELVSLQHCQYGRGMIEGVVIRCDGAEWLENRAKLVSPDFTQAIAEHWRHRALVWNRLTTAHDQGDHTMASCILAKEGG
jgi:ATP-dependent RNA circularization protein (DNA/RNA ligase family)